MAIEKEAVSALMRNINVTFLNSQNLVIGGGLLEA
jgi:hypothetical protein